MIEKMRKVKEKIFGWKESLDPRIYGSNNYQYGRHLSRHWKQITEKFETR